MASQRTQSDGAGAFLHASWACYKTASWKRCVRENAEKAKAGVSMEVTGLRAGLIQVDFLLGGTRAHPHEGYDVFCHILIKVRILNPKMLTGYCLWLLLVLLLTYLRFRKNFVLSLLAGFQIIFSLSKACTCVISLMPSNAVLVSPHAFMSWLLKKKSRDEHNRFKYLHLFFSLFFWTSGGDPPACNLISAKASRCTFRFKS